MDARRGLLGLPLQGWVALPVLAVGFWAWIRWGGAWWTWVPIGIANALWIWGAVVHARWRREDRGNKAVIAAAGRAPDVGALDSYKTDVWSLSDEALEYLVTTLPPDARILEFGSGKGTASLAARFKVWAVEHDEAYLHRYEGIQYIPAPMEGPFYEPGFPEDVLQRIEHDVLILDGPPGVPGREPWNRPTLVALMRAPIIVVDDVQRATCRLVADTLVARGYREVLIHEVLVDGQTHARRQTAILRSEDSVERAAV